MVAKLILIALSFAAFSAAAQEAPMRFQNIDAAKSWFLQAYSAHDLKKEAIQFKPDLTVDVFAFYAFRGSGVIRVDGWYYVCGDRSSCDLLTMADLGRRDCLQNTPSLTYEKPNLVIHAGSHTVIKVPLVDD